MWLQASDAVFDAFTRDAAVYWRNNVLPPGERWIVVELYCQDIRVGIRALTLANAIRRVTPARLLVLTGTDRWWFEALWTEFDVERARSLARAYGADEVVDLHEVLDHRIAGGGRGSDVELAGTRLPVPDADDPARTPPDELAANVDRTVCRVLRLPRPPADAETDDRVQDIRRRTEEFADVYDAVLSGLRPVAFVTSHVDYNMWGLAVQSARRSDVPVLHVQSTGGLKAYAAFPARRRGLPTLRAELTVEIAEHFEAHVWPQREAIRRSAELVAWRSKGNFGRPSWWRGGDVAALELRTVEDRAAVRAHVRQRFGFHAGRPVVVVYNHAVSDALGTNVEHFPDLATWFERTAQHAVDDDEASWLFLDHPAAGLYDTTGFFEAARQRYSVPGRVVFRPGLTKNALWSLVDLGVTMRGSVSNELPAYGIPVVQAGWSEWSHLGLSMLAQDEADYWSLLRSSVSAVAAGRTLVSDEQVERARLWHWFYRSAADVVSPLVPHWEQGQGDDLIAAIDVHMRHVESDGDAVFSAVERMWSREEPFLTRLDLASPDELRHVLPRTST